MTKVDSSGVSHLRTPLDPESTGQVPVTATTPLPEGWTSFCSMPCEANPARWYATAPYHISSLGAGSAVLAQTVDAPSWTKLHEAVQEQVRLYKGLMG